MSHPATPGSEDTLDRDRLRATLQAVAARTGKTPTVVDFHNDDQTDIHPKQYVEEYDTWETALKDAGLDPEEMGSKQIPDRELLAELQRLASILERSPTRADMKEHGQYSDTVYQNRFGSWNEALEQAMLGTRRLSEDELKRELRRLARELERVPRANDMQEYGAHAPVTYHRRFGSWLDALDEANLLR
ncbi:homing endonuclease associated repeat-containing protein [Halorussus salinus]|uniref:homing endonuclease associated repeat-containing protein n=1 Tax=Halorussus salinus TaxID=1364935 RepID=UPI00109281B3|nr:hypothetical protein [Halorussus salinus]